MRRKHIIKNSPAQQDSENSILKTIPTGLLAVRLVPQSSDPSCPLVFKTASPQRNSIMSNGRLSGVFCRRQGGGLPENSPAQLDSIMSNLDFTLCPPRSLRLTDGCPVLYAGRMGITPVQRDSGISNFREGNMVAQRIQRMESLPC